MFGSAVNNKGKTERNIKKSKKVLVSFHLITNGNHTIKCYPTLKGDICATSLLILKYLKDEH